MKIRDLFEQPAPRPAPARPAPPPGRTGPAANEPQFRGPDGKVVPFSDMMPRPSTQPRLPGRAPGAEVTDPLKPTPRPGVSDLMPGRGDPFNLLKPPPSIIPSRPPERGTGPTISIPPRPTPAGPGVSIQPDDQSPSTRQGVVTRPPARQVTGTEAPSDFDVATGVSKPPTQPRRVTGTEAPSDFDVATGVSKPATQPRRVTGTEAPSDFDVATGVSKPATQPDARQAEPVGDPITPGRKPAPATPELQPERKPVTAPTTPELQPERKPAPAPSPAPAPAPAAAGSRSLPAPASTPSLAPAPAPAPAPATASSPPPVSPPAGQRLATPPPTLTVGDASDPRSASTLSQIAQNVGTNVDKLMTLNPNIRNANAIVAGQTINIPPAKELTPGVGSVYAGGVGTSSDIAQRVAKGEYLPYGDALRAVQSTTVPEPPQGGGRVSASQWQPTKESTMPTDAEINRVLVLAGLVKK